MNDFKRQLVAAHFLYIGKLKKFVKRVAHTRRWIPMKGIEPSYVVK
jgi:hypothetical protein